LERWGRSLVDLVNTLQELNALEVGFVSLSEALDLTTPSGRALAGMLAVLAEFERDILRDRVKAGIAQARIDGKIARPATDRRQAGSGNAPASQAGTERTGNRQATLHQPHFSHSIAAPQETGFAYDLAKILR
jgi:DNA invertase Pin-like site-specific DNA recombinase